MLENMLEELLSLLEGQKAALLTLAGISEAKERRIGDRAVGELEELVESERELLAGLSGLEERRGELALRLAPALGLEADGLSMSAIISRLEDNELKRSFAELQSELGDILEAQRERNTRIRALLDLQLGYTDTMLELLYQDEGLGNTYDSRGAVGGGGSGPRFIEYI